MANFNQKVSSADIAPADPTWHDATPVVKLEFFRVAGEKLVATKRAELARGIGSNGRRMAARKRPRPDGANGPVLTPHDAASRTSRLLRPHATVESVTLYWLSGHSKAQRLPWGTILGFHARGEVPGAAARDVRLSRRGINQVRTAMARWWAEHHAPRLRAERDRREQEQAEQDRKRKPKGIAARAAAKAKAAVVKKYPGLGAYMNPRGGGF